VAELLTRLRDDLTAARKAQDKAATTLLGTLLADVKNRELELRQAATDDDVRDVLRKAIKRRREAHDMYAAAGRTDLAEHERAEIAALERYLPPAVDDEELRAAVRAAIAGGAGTVGAVMGRVMPQFKSRADGSRINAIAREELSRRG
jgi:uncharacterized protein YqeY